MHFVERLVVDVAGIDARSQAAHEPRSRGLAEDRRAHRVDADQPQLRVEFTKDACDAGRVASGAHRAHQDINGAELFVQFQREPAVGVDVIGVAVLIGMPGARVGGQDLLHAVTAGLLPASLWVRFSDQFDVGAECGEHILNDRLHPGVGDQGDGVPVDRSG